MNCTAYRHGRGGRLPRAAWDGLMSKSIPRCLLNIELAGEGEGAVIMPDLGSRQDRRVPDRRDSCGCSPP